jgi:hypothetical protein
VDKDEKVALLGELYAALCAGGEPSPVLLMHLDRVRDWLGITSRDFVALLGGELEKASGAAQPKADLLERLVDIGLELKHEDPLPTFDGLARALQIPYGDLDVLLAGKPSPRAQAGSSGNPKSRSKAKGPKRRRRGTQRRPRGPRPEEDGRMPPLERKTEHSHTQSRISPLGLLGRGAGLAVLLVAIPYGFHFTTGEGPKLKRARQAAIKARVVQPKDIRREKQALRAQSRVAQEELSDRRRMQKQAKIDVERAEREAELLDDSGPRLRRWKSTWKKRRGEFREAFGRGRR